MKLRCRFARLMSVRIQPNVIGERPVPHTTDFDLTARDVAELASPDSIAAFFAKLGYDTARRTTLSPEAIGLSGETAGAIKRIETLSEDPEQFLRIVFAQPKSLTARVRNDLVRVLGRGTLDHVLVAGSPSFPGSRCRETRSSRASPRWRRFAARLRPWFRKCHRSSSKHALARSNC